MAEEPVDRAHQSAAGITVTTPGDPANLGIIESGRYDIPFLPVMPYELDSLQPGERENKNLAAQFTGENCDQISSGVDSNRGVQSTCYAAGRLMLRRIYADSTRMGRHGSVVISERPGRVFGREPKHYLTAANALGEGGSRRRQK